MMKKEISSIFPFFSCWRADDDDDDDEWNKMMSKYETQNQGKERKMFLFF